MGNFDGTADSDININADGGTFLQFAGTVDVESDINMAEDFKPCAYRISGGTLIVGENVLARGGTGLDSLEVSGTADVVIGGRVFFNSMNNLLKMTGAACSLAIQGIGQTGAEVIDVGSATATLECEFVDGSVSPVRVEAAAGNLIDLRNCQLVLGGDLPESGSHLLLENVNGCCYLGNFTGLGEGETVEMGGYVYAISYLGGDGDDVELTPGQAIAVQEFTLPITHSRNFYRIEATLP